jgi:hypothetical protein
VKIIRTLILILIFCSPGWAGERHAGTVDLLIVAGQSNAVGFDTSARELPSSYLDKEVLFWWRCGAPPADNLDSTSKHQWTSLQAQPDQTQILSPEIKPLNRNFQSPEGGFGPEIGLARTLLRQQPGQPLAIIKIAYNGTSVTEWQRPVGKKFNCYQALVSETKLAIREAEKKGLTMRLRALIWVQGESDGNNLYAGQYEHNLKTMIIALRRDLNAPGLIVLLGFNTDFKAGSPAVQQVVQAQKNLAAEHKLIAYVNSRNCAMANGVHFSSKGTMELGRLFAKKLILTEKKLKQEQVLPKK